MRVFCLISFLFTTFFLSAQPTALSPRTANYEMDIRLNPTEKTLDGHTVLHWKNPSADTVRELQFHLYYNAFKNTESTWLQESGGLPGFLASSWGDECGWGWTDMRSIKDEAGNELRPNAQYIHPDDDNEKDQTVLKVPLLKPVGPGESIQITYDWNAKIPKSMIRMGYNKDFYFFAQWFPKVGVFEPAGTRYAETSQWNCHQYHASGEYYSDFGNYKVRLSAPSDFVVAASGVQTNQTTTDQYTTWTYEVEDVIDFSWTASPHFQVLEDQWQDVQLKLLCYPGHEHYADRYFTTIKNAFDYLDEHIGPYPYPSLTIIDPPIHGLFTGGMEYPTFITSISFCFIPEGIRTTETLVTHEFIHQYFMQMVATHEVEEPWMDEGMTTYYEMRILDHFLGEHASIIDWMGIQVGNAEYNRAEFLGMDNPRIAPNSYKSYEYKHGGYGPIAYNKTAIWLKTMEGILGRSTFDEIMRTYFERWKFKHPCKTDFTDIVNEIVQKNHGQQFGQDMHWFFDQVLEGTEMCDYQLAAITNETEKMPAGYLTGTDECIMPSAGEEGDRIYSSVILHRIGNMQLPLEVKIEFENGESTMEYWDGRGRSKEFNFVSNSKIRQAEIDPERKLWIDANFLNNSLTATPQTKGIRKYVSQFMTGIQHLLHTLNAFI